MPTHQCRAKAKSTGNQCRRPAIPGGVVCRMHGGAAPQVKAAAARRLALAEARGLVAEYGIEVETTPEEALLQAVWEAAGNVALLRKLVAELEQGYGVEGIAYSTGNDKKTNEAAPHVFVVMYNQERDRLVRFAKACADAGIQERLVTVAEAQARLMIEAFEATIIELGVADRVAARETFGKHLRRVS